MNLSPERHSSLLNWLSSLDGAWEFQLDSLTPASSDASSRRYWRLQSARGPVIVMDAPPAVSLNNEAFVREARRLAAAQLPVPALHAVQSEDGWMLLSDLGATTLQSWLATHPEGADRAYRQATALLLRLQALELTEAERAALPVYDAAFFRREMDLCTEWYLTQHAGLALSDADQAVLERSFALITAQCVAQPQGYVHRDFHSRNLMVQSPEATQLDLGLLDFQDAVWGPVTYDLASLLRDAYVHWDEAQQFDWGIRHWEAMRKAGLPVDSDFGEFWRQLEWMGLQRHLKILGIFARLSIRDAKPQYLADIPRVWQAAYQVCARYSGLGALAGLLEKAAGEHRHTGYTF